MENIREAIKLGKKLRYWRTTRRGKKAPRLMEKERWDAK